MTLRPLSSILLAACVSSLAVADDLPGADAIGELAGFVGDWHFEGVALEGFEGIDGGEAFRATQTVRWVVPHKELGIEWTLVTASGHQFSSGRSRIRWDDISGAVLNTYAGVDGDQSYRGVSTLIGMKGIDFDWRGHESAGTGSSLNYETTFALSDGDHWRVDFIPTCADDSLLEPMRFVWERDNEFKKALGEYASIVGEWSRVYQDEQDRTVLRRIEIAWGPGERSLLIGSWDVIGDSKVFRGAEVIYLDPQSDMISGRMVAANGATWSGTFKETKTNNGTIFGCVFTGSSSLGEPIRGTLAFELEGSTLSHSHSIVVIAANGDEVLSESTRLYHRE